MRSDSKTLKTWTGELRDYVRGETKFSNAQLDWMATAILAYAFSRAGTKEVLDLLRGMAPTLDSPLWEHAPHFECLNQETTFSRGQGERK